MPLGAVHPITEEIRVEATIDPQEHERHLFPKADRKLVLSERRVEIS